MKVWRWHCEIHDLTVLVAQTHDRSPSICNELVELIWPDSELCAFTGYPIFNIVTRFPGREAPRVPTPSSRSGIVPGLAEAGYPSPLPVTRT